MTNQELADYLKSAALTIGDKAVMALLIADFPFLGLPIINQITSFVVNLILQKAIQETEIAAFFLFIDVRSNQQGRDFASAAQMNHVAQQSGTAQEKADAEAKLKTAFYNFASFVS